MARKKAIDTDAFTFTTPKCYDVTIEGVTPLLFNKLNLDDFRLTKAEKPNQEKVDNVILERHNWPKKAYYDENYHVYIPGENLKESLKDGAKYWGAKIAGSGNKTYTDVITKGVVCGPLYLGITRDDLIPFEAVVNGNPSRGKNNGVRVLRIRPMVDAGWKGTFRLHAFDGRLTPEVLSVIITYAGYGGVCDWRPTFGRYALVELKEVVQ